MIYHQIVTVDGSERLKPNIVAPGNFVCFFLLNNN